jgi:uncharacterized Zn finger protein
MPAPRAKSKRSKSAPSTTTTPAAAPAVEGWVALTWDDLSRWAGGGSITRGRAYQRGGRVKDLALSADGRLLASVSGGALYTVTAELTSEAKVKLMSRCSCPVGTSGCKHAVAVVAEYLQRLADGLSVPVAAADDPRWAKLDPSAKNSRRDFDPDFDESDDEADWDSADEYADNPLLRISRRTVRKRRAQTDWTQKIEQHVRGQSREALADLVCTLIQRFPELHEEFRERIALSEGDVDRLVAQARKELRRVTQEPGWSNHWNNEGHTPDYSKLKHRLERLMELGHPDAVVLVGRELISCGMQQVAVSHDEGETGMELAACLPVVFQAVARSNLRPAEQILFAIDTYLEDPYDIVGEAPNDVLNAGHLPVVWSEVADQLTARLDGLPANSEGDFHRGYARDRISGWLADALEKAGRGDEILPLYEREARLTCSYERLVQYLIETQRFDDATRWAQEGIEKTLQKWPGIASNLAKRLTDVAQRRRQWPLVAAHAAVEFFDRPSAQGFHELMQTARRAKCENAVRAATLRYLETGELPFGRKSARKVKAESSTETAWPLPLPEWLAPLQRINNPQPHLDVLLDLALEAQRPDEVLHWYDKLNSGRSRSSAPWNRMARNSDADEVAAAVAKSHPERALAIYGQGLEANLTHAHQSAYANATEYLKQMRPILKSLGREAEWDQLVVAIREKHRNRPRFMELLDRLQGRTIVAAAKTRRRK